MTGPRDAGAAPPPGGQRDQQAQHGQGQARTALARHLRGQRSDTLAYRILDPNIQPDNQVTTNSKEQEDSRPWFEVLWDSVAQPPEEEAPAGESHHLPIEPAPEESGDVR